MFLLLLNAFLATMSSAKPPVKRTGGLKVVVKRKKNAKRKLGGEKASSTTRGLPSSSTTSAQHEEENNNTVASQLNPPSLLQQHHHQQHVEDPFSIDEEDEEDIPCDTLMAMRSLEQSRAGLDIPMFVGTVPCVLESQLYERLKTQNGDDSIVTTELQQLSQFNKVRRLSDGAQQRGGQHTPIAAVMETRHYKRAVWDAHRHYGKAPPNIAAGFLSALNNITKRRISSQDLRQYWPTDESSWNDSNMTDTLVQMQVLLPVKDGYILWLPHWGLVLKQLSKAQEKVIQQLKRSMYKELSRKQVERLHHTGLSGQFVLHTLVSTGLVELQERPSGTFVRLVSKS